MKCKLTTTVFLAASIVWSLRVIAAPTKIDQVSDQSDEWFTSDEGRATLAVILSYQNPNGGWK